MSTCPARFIAAGATVLAVIPVVSATLTSSSASAERNVICTSGNEGGIATPEICLPLPVPLPV